MCKEFIEIKKENWPDKTGRAISLNNSLKLDTDSYKNDFDNFYSRYEFGELDCYNSSKIILSKSFIPSLAFFSMKI